MCAVNSSSCVFAVHHRPPAVPVRSGSTASSNRCTPEGSESASAGDVNMKSGRILPSSWIAILRLAVQRAVTVAVHCRATNTADGCLCLWKESRITRQLSVPSRKYLEHRCHWICYRWRWTFKHRWPLLPVAVRFCSVPSRCQSRYHETVIVIRCRVIHHRHPCHTNYQYCRS